jgi:hypothetical protein
MLISVDNNNNLLQQIVSELTIDNHENPNNLDELEPPELCRQVTGEVHNTTIKLNGHILYLNAFITPGEWFLKENGEWDRRYGGQYEIMDLFIRLPDDVVGTNILRDYGRFNRQLVDGKFQWVRIDLFPDFLEIDQTYIQTIKPLLK